MVNASITIITLPRTSHRIKHLTITAAASKNIITIATIAIIITREERVLSRHRTSVSIDEVGVDTCHLIAAVVVVASCQAILEVRPSPAFIGARNSLHSIAQTRLQLCQRAACKSIEVRTLDILSGEKT